MCFKCARGTLNKYFLNVEGTGSQHSVGKHKPMKKEASLVLELIFVRTALAFYEVYIHSEH